MQTLMRGVRARGLGFEFVRMDRDGHARLRKLLLDSLAGSMPEEQEVVASTRS